MDRTPDWSLTGLVLVLFTVVAIAGAFTAMPQADEAAYAQPGYNIAYNGHSGTTLFHLPEYMPLSFAKRTYSAPPGYFYISAAWFRIFGWGLIQVRMLSVFFAVVALLSVKELVFMLTQARGAALLSMSLVAVDYFFQVGASHGRPEMVCGGLGTAAMAAYVCMRKTSLAGAFFWSHALATTAILVHPVGVGYWLGLLSVILYLDRRSLSMSAVLAGVAPCLVGISLWGIYILADVQGFSDQWKAVLQFNANVFDDSGLSKFGALRNLQLEVLHRYLAPFGFLPGVSWPSRLKALVLIAYAGGVVGCLVSLRLRHRRGVIILPFLVFINWIYLALVSPGKFSYYLPHVTVLMAMCLGVALYCSGPRWIYMVWMLPIFLGAVQIAGVVHLISLNVYEREYAPAVAAIVRNTKAHALVVGPPELWFGIGPERSVIHDPTLGYRNELVPEVYVIDPLYRQLDAKHAKADPGRHAYVQKLITGSRRLFKGEQYEVLIAADDAVKRARAPE